MTPAKPMPLVLQATQEAVQDAERLGLDRPLENLVHEAILAGRIASEPGVGRHTSVFVDPDLVVRVLRTRSKLSGRRAWLPVGVGRSRPWT